MKLWLTSAIVLVAGYATLAIVLWFFWAWILSVALIAALAREGWRWYQEKRQMDGLCLVLEENLFGFELPIAIEARKIIQFPSTYRRIHNSVTAYSFVMQQRSIA